MVIQTCALALRDKVLLSLWVCSYTLIMWAFRFLHRLEAHGTIASPQGNPSGESGN
jgi:hypothetical protein